MVEPPGAMSIARTCWYAPMPQKNDSMNTTAHGRMADIEREDRPYRGGSGCQSRLRRTIDQNNLLGSFVKHTSVPSTAITSNALIAIQLIAVCSRPGGCASPSESSVDGAVDIQAQCSASGAQDSGSHRPVIGPSLPSLQWHARVGRSMTAWLRSSESVEFVVKCLAVVFIVTLLKKVLKCVSAAANRPRVE
jgi:hypothetical protein